MSGTLYVVSTPIGNLDDITERARTVLGQVDAVAAEDTRHSGYLLDQLGIRVPRIAYHDHNEQDRTPALIERLRTGESLALICDAGTPLVSDPGYRLVRAARAAEIPVVPVPGASALLAALAVAGLPTDEFHFQGFLPARGAARERAVQDLARRPVTSVVYEAPRRVVELLAALEQVAGGDREVVIGRELTKRFETLLSGPLSEVRTRVEADPDQRRGELVLVVAGAPATAMDADQLEPLARALLRELPASRAARVLAAFSGRKRQELYRWLEDLDA
jgi:16S rRNA (cytidine1402-2'-O)-methyltransferase